LVKEDGLQAQVEQLVPYFERHKQVGRLVRAMAVYRSDTRSEELAQKYAPEPEEPDQPTGTLMARPVAAFNAVPSALQADPGARGQFKPFLKAYQEAAKYVDLLQRYKKLHHCLHCIELKLSEIREAAVKLADPEKKKRLDAVRSLESYSRQIKQGDNLNEFISGLEN